MNKFGLEPENTQEREESPNLAERLAAFPVSAPRPRINIPEVDAVAAAHGFISREAAPTMKATQGRRRRIGSIEPTRHLAIRLPVSQYDRFVAYADEHQLTYQDALAKLLSEAVR